MGRIVRRYYPVTLLSVTKMNGGDESEWKWRELYIGQNGCLDIRESDKKHPGEKYAVFECPDLAELRTSYGKTEQNENQLIFTTENSIYEFEMRKEHTEWEKQNEIPAKEPSD